MKKLKTYDFFMCHKCRAINGFYLKSTSYPVEGHFTYYRPIAHKGKWLFGMRRTNERAPCRDCGEYLVAIFNPSSWTRGNRNFERKEDAGTVLAFSFKVLGVEFSRAGTKLSDAMTSAARFFRGRS